MTPVEDVLLWAVAQESDKYRLGAEAFPEQENPDEFDCSELVEWSCAKAGVSPPMPDGSGNQLTHCINHQTMLSVDVGIKTRGALLFRGDNGTRWGHVAFSLGDGTTFEARGRLWGVNYFNADRRVWTHAAKIPGCSYEDDVAKRPPKYEILIDDSPIVDWYVEPGTDGVALLKQNGKIVYVGSKDLGMPWGHDFWFDHPEREAVYFRKKPTANDESFVVESNLLSDDGYKFPL